MSIVKNRTHIMIDGYNLGLERGTGVATYGKNLSTECTALGYDVHILYGIDTARDRKSAFLREVEFFSGETPRDSGWSRWMRGFERTRFRSKGPTALDIPVSGIVLTDALKNRLPDFNQIWNAPDLYNLIHYQFEIYRKFTEMRNVSEIDIAHWTYPIPVKMDGAKNVYTLHDLVPLRLPYTTLDNKKKYLALNRRIVRDADHIITVSEQSRRDIIDILGCPSDKVTNTYQSVSIPDHLFKKTDAQVRAEVEGTFGLPFKNYILFFGAIEPKKNVGRLIEAYLATETTAPLVIVGPTAWKSDQELRLMNEFLNQQANQNSLSTTQPIGDQIKGKRIIRLEYLPFPLLVSIIRAALITVFPSLYEGFGLPILESMILGTPVITSNVGATAEIAGNAAILVDPYTPVDMAAAIDALIRDVEMRSRLVALGKERAEAFSPERYRERLNKVYSRVLNT